MPKICFDTNTFLLFSLFALTIIGYAVWKAYNMPLAVKPQKENYTITSVMSDPSVTDMPPRELDIHYRRDTGTFPRFTGLPMNIPTRAGYSNGAYQRMGVVYHNTNEEYRLPLFGRRDYPGSSHYRYYVMDHTNHQNQIEIEHTDFLNDQDKIKVPGYPGTFTVHLYHLDFPDYHPNVIGSRGGP
jgi:hypothetical protein